MARPVLGPHPRRRRDAAVSRSGRRSIARRWARARPSRCSKATGCRRISSTSYERVTEQLVDAVEQCFEEVGDYRELRIHGDCHRNNVLWTDDGPHFVDLDDCMNGPAVQDLWLFLAGSRDEMAAQLGDLLEGYGKFVDFDYRELRLIEALRALRLIHYTAWITRRWDDPAFPRAFPWLGEARYWEEHVQALLEQRAALDEEPLAVVV